MDKNAFINQATNMGADTKENRELLGENFEKIHGNVECAHCIADPYHMADYLLNNQNIDGPIVEFGCFKGGMSAKLSLVAKLLNKKYIIFDSFEGLQAAATYELWEEYNTSAHFKKNDYAGTFEEVTQNISKYGSLESCEFVRGIIEDTLPNFKENPCFIFVDVDIIETAQFIIKNMWHRLKSKWLFTHESCIKDYVHAIMNENWWQENLSMKPPMLGSSLFQTGHALKNSGCLDCLIKN